MPTRSNTRQPRSFGREDYVTAAVALVLQADVDAHGTLVEGVLGELYGIELHGRPTVTAQAEHADLGCGVAYIDLQIHTDADLVLLENKTGTGLGMRIDRVTGDAVDQLEKYTRILDHEATIPVANRHLGMLVWSPQPVHGSSYFRRSKYWWDLYEVVGGARSTGDGYADRLRAELLRFFEYLELDPIVRLSRDNVADVAVVHRLLARATSLAITEGVELVNVRPATATGYLFELTTVHGEREPFGFGFSAGSLYAHVSNSGYRRVQLPDGFFSASDVDVQVRALTEILRGLRAAPRDPSRTDALEEDLFLAGFGALRPAIEALFERAREAGWTLRIGSAEAPMRMPKSTAIVVYPSASYARPGVRIWCASVMLRDRVAAVVGAAFPMDEVVAKDAVKLFPGEQTRVSDLIPLLEALAVEM